MRIYPNQMQQPQHYQQQQQQQQQKPVRYFSEQLQVLNRDQFDAAIEMKKYHHVGELDLDMQVRGDADLENLLPHILRCENLRVLSLRRNRLRNVSCLAGLSSCANLESLKISYNLISSLDAMMQGLARCAELSSFAAEGNELSNTSATAIDQLMLGCPKLESALFADNNISADVWCSLNQSAIVGHPCLRNFSVSSSSCHLDELRGAFLLDMVKQERRGTEPDLSPVLKNIGEVSLHPNASLTPSAILPAEVLSLLGYCSGLKSLTITNYEIQDWFGFQSVLSSCRGLRELSLVGTDAADLTAFLPGLKTCSELEFLQIIQSKVGDVNASAFGDLIGSCPNLKSVLLYGNKLTVDCFRGLARSVAHHDNLQLVMITQRANELKELQQHALSLPPVGWRTKSARRAPAPMLPEYSSQSIPIGSFDAASDMQESLSNSGSFTEGRFDTASCPSPSSETSDMAVSLDGSDQDAEPLSSAYFCPLPRFDDLELDFDALTF
eukprot:m.546148 g.546148  ORF g.546148 m.546148 type:complete len:497 (+) comp57679_c1_seq2:108-1598(+)